MSQLSQVGVSRFRSALLYLWQVIRVPPHFRPLYFVVYSVTTLTGIATLVSPPASIEGVIGTVLSAIWAWCLITGGVIGTLTVFTPVWALERIGIVFALVGISVYLYVVASLHIVSEVGQSRLTQIGMIIVCACAFIARFMAIWGYTFEPQTGAHRR